jgi:ubiquinone/menaquinone biosynthesis C-methylase UbiE
VLYINHCLLAILGESQNFFCFFLFGAPQLSQELSAMVGKQKARVLDLCCGVGTSTRALQIAFPDAATVIGMDTSKEMVGSCLVFLVCVLNDFSNIFLNLLPFQVAMADFLTKHLDALYRLYSTTISPLSDSYKLLKKKGYAIKRVATHKAIKFLEGNAESTNLPDQSFDLVTVMWAFHEAPLQGRAKILNEARRLLSPGGVLAIVDISTEYIPSKTMLAGEPYVQEYQQNIHRQLQQIQGFKTPQYRSVVDNHLSMWTLTRSPSVA